MDTNSLKSTDDVAVLARKPEENVKKSTRLLSLSNEKVQKEKTLETQNKQDVKKADPISDALEGRLKYGDIVEYGYHIINHKRYPTKWSYVEIENKIDGKKVVEKYFICTSVIGEMAYSTKGYNNWESSDLKKALDENKFELYDNSESPLQKDDRLDSGITILSALEFIKVRKAIPSTGWYWSYWFRSTETVNYGSSYCLYKEVVRYADVHCIHGVRPAFRLKSVS